jgi:type II secretory pathway component GspD/PulD (secretin)
MKRLMISVLLSLCAVAAEAEQVMEVIALQHQTAEQLIPVLKPLVDADGALTGTQDRLIIRTSPENLAALKVALVELDRVPRQLRIWVRQSTEAKTSGNEAKLSGAYRSGDLSARVGQPHRPSDPRDLSIAVPEDGSSVQYRHSSTRGRDERHDLQHVLTLEGQPAFIRAGESVPFAEQQVYVSPYGTEVHEGISYRDVDSGFFVVPRLHGDRVTLEISPHQAALSARGGGAIEYHEASSVVSGRIGEWIDLGGVTEDHNEESRAILATTRRRGEQLRYISVRVEIVP